MALTDELFAAARPIWDAQIAHPFVRGIRDGSLEPERFKRWVLQDYLYLKELARLFGWAVTKAENVETMSWFGSVLHLTLNTEMQLHRDYAARFAISAEELESVTMWPTTRAYTDFLVRTAAEGDLADLIAALLPCAWSYVYIARQLAGDAPPADRRYADWIAQYASEEFAEVADWLRAELDRLGEGATPQKRQRLKELFLLSSRYEWRFWEMCWQGESWPL